MGFFGFGEIEIPNTAQLTRLAATCGVGIVFGVAYNAFVGYYRRRYPAHTDTSLLVVGGVLVTIILYAVIVGMHHIFFLVGLLILFSCTGLPMIIGDKIRANSSRPPSSGMDAVERGENDERYVYTSLLRQIDGD